MDRPSCSMDFAPNTRWRSPTDCPLPSRKLWPISATGRSGSIAAPFPDSPASQSMPPRLAGRFRRQLGRSPGTIHRLDRRSQENRGHIEFVAGAAAPARRADSVPGQGVSWFGNSARSRPQRPSFGADHHVEAVDGFVAACRWVNDLVTIAHTLPERFMPTIKGASIRKTAPATSARPRKP